MAKQAAAAWFQALQAAGLADQDTRRVVLDFKAGDMAVAYIEKYTDERALSVVQTLDGVEIRRDVAGDG